MIPPGDRLRFASVTRGTRLRYVAAARTFISTYHTRSTHPQLDTQLAEYINAQFRINPLRGNLTKMYYTLQGILLIAPGCNKFRLSRKELKGWENMMPRNYRLPMPEEVCKALFAYWTLTNHPVLAHAMRLLFYGLLRIGDLLKLSEERIVLGGPMTRAGYATLLFQDAKTGKYQHVMGGEMEFIESARFMKQLLAEDPEGLKKHVGSPGKFNKILASALRVLQVPFHLTSHSGRGGGAVRLHLNGTPVLDILRKGRWKKVKTLEHYLQIGVYHIRSLTLPTNVFFD
jgi:hypothetical protein